MKKYAIIRVSDCLEDYILNSFSYEEITDEFLLENDDLFLEESNIEKMFDTLEEAQAELRKNHYESTYSGSGGSYYCEMFAIMDIEYDSDQGEYVIGSEFYESSKPSLKLKKYFIKRELTGINKPLWYIDETMIEYDFFPDFEPEDIDQLEELIYKENNSSNDIKLTFRITSDNDTELTDSTNVTIDAID